MKTIKVKRSELPHGWTDEHVRALEPTDNPHGNEHQMCEDCTEMQGGHRAYGSVWVSTGVLPL